MGTVIEQYGSSLRLLCEWSGRSLRVSPINAGLLWAKSTTFLIYLQKMFQIVRNYFLLLVITRTLTTASDQLILLLASDGSRLIRPFYAGLLLAESKTCLIYLQEMFHIFKNYVLLLVITSPLTTASDFSRQIN